MFASTIAMLVASVSLVAQAPSQEAGSKSATAQQEQSAPEKVICKVDDEDTFSRIRKRVCKPESEWKRTKQKTRSE